MSTSTSFKQKSFRSWEGPDSIRTQTLTLPGPPSVATFIDCCQKCSHDLHIIPHYLGPVKYISIVLIVLHLSTVALVIISAIIL